jgi:hypothetical protein
MPFSETTGFSPFSRSMGKSTKYPNFSTEANASYQLSKCFPSLEMAATIEATMSSLATN